MKALQVVALGSLSALTMSSSCEKESAEPSKECTRTGYVIGLVPCSQVDKIGLILALESPRDTVYTYNLPKEVFTYTSSIAWSGRGDYLFAQTVRDGAKITLGYSLVPSAERSYGVCPITFYLGPFRKMTRDQEVTITCASKQE